MSRPPFLPKKAWGARSSTTATMLNPALIAVLIAVSAGEYERKRDEFMPWALSFIVLPLVLTKRTREALPRRTSTHVAHWCEQNPGLQVSIATQAASLTGHVREGLIFGVNAGLFELMPTGLIRAKWTPAQKAAGIGDIQSLIFAAAFLGRWFSKTDRASTLFALFGVSP